MKPCSHAAASLLGPNDKCRPTAEELLAASPTATQPDLERAFGAKLDSETGALPLTPGYLKPDEALKQGRVHRPDELSTGKHSCLPSKIVIRLYIHEL